MPRALDEVWSYYIVENDNGRKSVACSYCHLKYKQANATKMKEHFLVCRKCPRDVARKFSRVKLELSSDDEEFENVIDSIRERSPRGIVRNEMIFVSEDGQGNEVLFEMPSTKDRDASHNREPREPRVTRDACDIRDSQVNNDRQTINIDESLSRAIYATGLPLSLLESKYWKAALDEAKIHIPSKDSISNSLLATEYARVKSQVTHKLQSASAISLVVDGWSNEKSKGIVNFILTAPEPIFFKSVYPEPEWERDMGEFLSQEILKVIEIESTKFVAVITDCTPIMKLAWKKITDLHPHVTCVPCVSHTLNLLCGDILEIVLIKNIIIMVQEIVKCVKSNHVLLTRFEKAQMTKYGDVKCTKLPIKSQWIGDILTLEHFKSNKEAYEVVAKSHTDMFDRYVRDNMLSVSLSEKVDAISHIFQPILEALQRLESTTMFLSDVPIIFQKVSSTIEGYFNTSSSFSSRDEELIIECVNNRQKSCIKPIHLAANLLDPRYRGEHIEDGEIPFATEFISQYASNLYHNDDVKISQVLTNVASFKTKTNYYGISSSIWRPVQTVLPHIWWRTFAPNENAAAIAIQLLSVPASSITSQRIWKKFGSTLTRNVSKNVKNRDTLIFVQSNLYFMGNQSSDRNFSNDEDMITSDIE